MDFQSVVDEALASNCVRSDISDQNPTLRLVTIVVNRSERMSKDMASLGHTLDFDKPPKATSSDLVHDHFGFASLEFGEGEPECTVAVRQVSRRASGFRRSDLAAPKFLDLERASILAWLTDVHRNSLGSEIGTLNSSLLRVTMKHQSKKWNSLALEHIADVVAIIHTIL